MKYLSVAIFSFLFLFALPISSISQEQPDTSLVVIETTDGNEYIGLILSETLDEVALKTQNIGTIKIKRVMIEKIRPVKKTEYREGTYWFDNPFASTRYFYNPSGYGLPKGEGYYQNTWILMNQVSVGITDNFSLGVGLIPIFLFLPEEGGEYTPVWVTPKFSLPIKKDKINVGLGVLYLTFIGEENEGYGITYGVTTFGSKEKNVSVGLGWGYSKEDGIANTPTLSLSYLHRSKPKWAFVTENYLINGGDEAFIILSGGARYLGKKISIDFGGFTLLGEGSGIILPWLSIAVPFSIGGD